MSRLNRKLLTAIMGQGVSHKLWSFYITVWWFLNLLFRKSSSENVTCLVGKTAVVTGGKSGIGYALSTLLASRGCRVIIADVANAETSKNSIIEWTGNKNVTYEHLDLASFTTIRAFADKINAREGKIDILINNAGIGICKTQLSDDNLNKLMQVNFFGPFLLTHLLVDSLKTAPSSRVIFTSSVQSYASTLTPANIDMELNPVDFDVEEVNTMWNLYCNSKLCNMFAAQEFAEKLRKYNISVNSADPGAVATELFLNGDNFNKWYMKILRFLKFLRIMLFLIGEDNFGGCQTAFHLAASKDVEEVTGQNFFRCRQFVKHKLLEDRIFCDNLWKKTENLVRLNQEEKL